MSLFKRTSAPAKNARPTEEQHNAQEKKVVGDGAATDKEPIDHGVGELINSNVVTFEGTIVNSSGHRDQLQRHYGFFAICGLALSVDNAWVAIGTSLNVAIYNGGPPGVLYEFLVAAFYYSFIGASLAELASSIPSAGGVYHWASITPGASWGRSVGYFAGWINFFGWLFDLASIVYIMAELVIQMYFLYHGPPYGTYQVEQWHIFIALVIITWTCIGATIFFNRYLPLLQQIGLVIVLAGGIISIIVVVAMKKDHASTAFVWTEWDNQTGWSNGVAFLTGVLNGAFTIGTPDSVSHISEELPNPRRDVPRAIAAQLGLGSIYAFCFAIAILYGITDLDAVLEAQGSFPLATIYSQATGNRAATFGLLFIIFLSLTPCLIGTFLTVSRTWWALSRDNATPFAKIFSSVNERLSCPIPAVILTGVFTTAFGAIALGSHTAFSDLVGSFVILTTTSYALCFLPNILTSRKNVPRGPFWMGNAGFIVNGLAVAFIVLFNVFYCFPYALPTTVATMNYNSVILAGVVAIAAIWWIGYAQRHYEQPKVAQLLAEADFRRLSALKV